MKHFVVTENINMVPIAARLWRGTTPASRITFTDCGLYSFSAGETAEVQS